MVEFESAVVAVGFGEMLELMAVATVEGEIYVLKYVKKENGIDFTVLYQTNLELVVGED